MKLESRPLAPWKRRRNLQHILRYGEDIAWLTQQHLDSWLEGYADSASRPEAERFTRDLKRWLKSQ
jgi:hypothetical protein